MMKTKTFISTVLASLSFHAMLASDQTPVAIIHSDPHLLFCPSSVSSTSQSSDDLMKETTTDLALGRADLPNLSQKQRDAILSSETSADQEDFKKSQAHTHEKGEELPTPQSSTSETSHESPPPLSPSSKETYIKAWMQQVEATESQFESHAIPSSK